MHSLDRPIVEARHTERTAIADPLAQNLPGVRQMVAVRPGHFGHIAEMVRLGLAQTEGDRSLKLAPPILLNPVRGDQLFWLIIKQPGSRSVNELRLTRLTAQRLKLEFARVVDSAFDG